MTRISKSPLKHKQGNYKAHKGSDGVLYGEKLYHSKFGGNVEDSDEVEYSDGVSPDLSSEEETEDRAEKIKLNTSVAGGVSDITTPLEPKVQLKENKHENPEMQGFVDSGNYNPDQLEAIEKRLNNIEREENKSKVLEKPMGMMPTGAQTGVEAVRANVDPNATPLTPAEIIQNEGKEFVYRTEGIDGLGNTYPASWYQTTPGLNEGDTPTEIAVSEEIVPLQLLDGLRKSQREKFEKDPNSIEDSELLDVFRYDPSVEREIKNDINEQAEDFKKQKEEAEPEYSGTNLIPFQSWKQRQKANEESEFGIIMKTARTKLNDQFKANNPNTIPNISEEDVVEEAKSLLFQNREAQEIRDNIKEYADRTASERDKDKSWLQSIAELSPIVALTSEYNEKSPEQLALQERLNKRQKEISIEEGEDGEVVYGPVIQKNLIALKLSTDIITKNSTDLATTAEEFRGYGDVTTTINKLDNLKNQISELEKVAVDGVLQQEDYDKYQTLLGEYNGLLAANKDKINGAYEAQVRYDKLITTRKSLFEARNMLGEEQEGIIEDLNDLNLFIDANSRNYDFTHLFYNRLGNSAINLVDKIESMHHAVQPQTLLENGLKEYYKVDPTARGQEKTPDHIVALLTMKSTHDAPRERVKNGTISTAEQIWVNTSWVLQLILYLN